MESQLELSNEVGKYEGMFLQALPDVDAARIALRDAVYKDGALSLKVKRLIALAVAVRAACIPSIVHQTMLAVEAGASKDEVMETMSVLLAISGITASSESYRVFKVLEELGKL